LIKENVILANNEDDYLNGLLAVMIWGYSGNIREGCDPL
jgi:hypothetical protein